MKLALIARRILMAAAVALGFASGSGKLIGQTTAGPEVLVGDWNGRQVEYMARELNIIFETDVTPDSIAPLVSGQGWTSIDRSDSLHWLHVSVPQSADIMAVIASVKDNPHIKIIEPNFVCHAFTTPNDTYFNLQWAFQNTGQGGGTSGADIKAVPAWGITQGSSTIKLAVLDTGIPLEIDGNDTTLDHPDLNDTAKFILGPSYAVQVPPCDDSSNNANLLDVSGHGTGVLGVIGALTNNSTGVAGTDVTPVK